MSFFKRILSPITKIKEAVKKTNAALGKAVRNVLTMHRVVDQDFLDDLEEILLGADLGPDITFKLVDRVKEAYRYKEVENPNELLNFLKQELVNMLSADDRDLRVSEKNPTVILVVGVNGTGKTTSIGKLSNYLKKQGQSVMLGACDTFRAAATEQLTIWSERADIKIVKGEAGADPASVAYMATESAIAKNVDYLILDTAGRLQTKKNLMIELEKISRVVKKLLPGAPHEVILVLDATTGQNGVMQAQKFSDYVNVTGIFLAKLDGTAKGGIVLSLRHQFNLPVKFVGLGEQMDDVAVFDPQEFIDGFFDLSDSDSEQQK